MVFDHNLLIIRLAGIVTQRTKWMILTKPNYDFSISFKLPDNQHCVVWFHFITPSYGDRKRGLSRKENDDINRIIWSNASVQLVCVCVYYDLTTLRLSEPNQNSLHSKWVRTVYRVNGIRCFCLIKMLKAVTAAAAPPVETVTTPAPVYGSHNNNKDQRSRIIQVKKKTRTKKNWSKSRNTGCMNNTTIPKILCMVHFPPTVNSLLYS